MALEHLRQIAAEADALAERNAQQTLELNKALAEAKEMAQRNALQAAQLDRAAEVNKACQGFDRSAMTLTEGGRAVGNGGARGRRKHEGAGAAEGAFATIESMMRDVSDLNTEVRRFLEFLRAA